MARGQPDLMNIPHEGLCPGPNYRTSFDDSTIAELADSIATHGLLQNLVVTTPLLPAGKWVIISGERRWRAIGLLIDQQRWPAERMIPCQLREDLSGDQAGIRIAALIENLQREDVNPMEEAECFAAIRSLAPDRFSTEAIATQIGKTMRYVQQRLALAERLAPDIKDKVRAGTISVTQAREIAIATNPKAQAKLADIAQHNPLADASTLRQHVLSSMLPASRVQFDLADYDGERIEVDGIGYLADRSQALKLQAAWAKAEAERTGAAFLEVSHYWAPGYPAHGKIWRRAETPAEKKKAVTLLVLMRDVGEVKRFENMTDAEVHVPGDRAARKPSPNDKAEDAAWEAHRDACARLSQQFEADARTTAAGPLAALGDALAPRLATLSPAALRWLCYAAAMELANDALAVYGDRPLDPDVAAFLREIGIALPPEIRVEGEAWTKPAPDPAAEPAPEPANERRSPKKKKAA